MSTETAVPPASTSRLCPLPIGPIMPPEETAPLLMSVVTLVSPALKRRASFLKKRSKKLQSTSESKSF
jgi:hypothetical protein